MDNELQAVKDYLKELDNDATVPKNVKSKIASILSIMDGKEEDNIKINKAIDELDEICNDGNLQPYTRTQLWNVVSMLENI